MQSPNFGKSVRTMLRALTYVTDNSNIDVVPSVKNGNDKYHAVGLGAMNLHGFLAKNKIMYGSEESLEFVDVYFMLLNYWTLVESNNIAKERKETFFEFEKSEYADGEYFRKYLSKINGYKESNEFSFKFDKIKKLFKNIFIPSLEDWKNLEEKIKKYGLYNA